MEVDFRKRRSIRLSDYDYSQPGGYFVTLVAHNRQNLFGEIVQDAMEPKRLGELTMECWQAIPLHCPHVSVDDFILMPNHFHGIVIIHENDHVRVGARIAARVGVRVGAQHAAPQPIHFEPHVTPGSLGAIVRSFKSAVSRHARIELGQTKIWQCNYYEHIIRNEKEHARIVEYIQANPINWNTDDENPSHQ